MYRIKINFSPAYHSQANGMVEDTNKLIVGNLRKNLEDKERTMVGGASKGLVGTTNNKEESDG